MLPEECNSDVHQDQGKCNSEMVVYYQRNAIVMYVYQDQGKCNSEMVVYYQRNAIVMYVYQDQGKCNSEMVVYYQRNAMVMYIRIRGNATVKWLYTTWQW